VHARENRSGNNGWKPSSLNSWLWIGSIKVRCWSNRSPLRRHARAVSASHSLSRRTRTCSAPPPPTAMQRNKNNTHTHKLEAKRGGQRKEGDTDAHQCGELVVQQGHKFWGWATCTCAHAVSNPSASHSSSSSRWPVGLCPPHPLPAGLLLPVGLRPPTPLVPTVVAAAAVVVVVVSAAVLPLLPTTSPTLLSLALSAAAPAPPAPVSTATLSLQALTRGVALSQNCDGRPPTARVHISS
jgi:hypothetical protein